MCKIIDKTCLSPTPTLEQHLMWDDIAILARYMLMLSFNNSLDVAAHLPYLFHVVTFLVATGPLSLRASTHGLVINIIHSLCTCSQLHFSGEFQESNLCFTSSFLHFTHLTLDWHRLPYYLLWYLNTELLNQAYVNDMKYNQIKKKKNELLPFHLKPWQRCSVHVCHVDSSSYHISWRLSTGWQCCFTSTNLYVKGVM